MTPTFPIKIKLLETWRKSIFLSLLLFLLPCLSSISSFYLLYQLCSSNFFSFSLLCFSTFSPSVLSFPLSFLKPGFLRWLVSLNHSFFPLAVCPPLYGWLINCTLKLWFQRVRFYPVQLVNKNLQTVVGKIYLNGDLQPGVWPAVWVFFSHLHLIVTDWAVCPILFFFPVIVTCCVD